GFDTEFVVQERGGRLVTAAGRGAHHRQLAAFEVVKSGDVGVGVHDYLHLVAGFPVFVSHHGRGNEPGGFDRIVHGSCREAGNVQAAGPHRFNLSGVAFNGEVDDVPAGNFGDVVEEFAKGVLVDGRVFGRRVGEHQGRRVEEVRGIGRGVGQHV